MPNRKPPGGTTCHLPPRKSYDLATGAIRPPSTFYDLGTRAKCKMASTMTRTSYTFPLRYSRRTQPRKLTRRGTSTKSVRSAGASPILGSRLPRRSSRAAGRAGRVLARRPPCPIILGLLFPAQRDFHFLSARSSYQKRSCRPHRHSDR
eukprot:scaffold41812_cov32-Tisochrysis_lutea.AAC.9